MLLKSRASPDMLPFGLCNKKRLEIRHMNRPLFPTTLSIQSYDIRRYVGLRAYEYPLVFTFLSLFAVECACLLELLAPEYEVTTVLQNIDVTQLTSHQHFSFLNN